MPSSAVHGSLVVSSNLTFTVQSTFQEKWIISSCCQESGKIFLDPQKLEPRVGVTRQPVYPVRSREGECYKV